MSEPFRDRSEILDGPPSIGDRVVEQAEYIRLLEAEVERLRAALNALVIVNGSEIGYRTMHNIPMAMSKRIESKVRAALRGEGEK